MATSKRVLKNRIQRFNKRVDETRAKQTRRTTKPIQIKTVSFRGMLMIEKFQNLHLEATADVPEGRTARETLDHLKKFVAVELRRARDGQEDLPPAGTFRRELGW